MGLFHFPRQRIEVYVLYDQVGAFKVIFFLSAPAHWSLCFYLSRYATGIMLCPRQFQVGAFEFMFLFIHVGSLEFMLLLFMLDSCGAFGCMFLFAHVGALEFIFVFVQVHLSV